MHPHIPISLVYDSIDWLEETLLCTAKIQRVNRIVIQKLFIDLKEAPTHVIITKSKRQSINVVITTVHLWDQTSGQTRPQPPVTTKIQDQRYTFEQEKSLKKNLIWVICRFLKCSNQLVSSRHRMQIERTSDVQKTSRTSSECLMYVQFTSCIYAVNSWTVFSMIIRNCNKYDCD